MIIKIKITLSTLLFVAALSQVSLGVGRVLLQGMLIDFSVYYEASKALITGVNPYTRLFAENIPFNYPPASFLFFIPMTILPPQIAQIVLTILSLLSLLFVGVLLTPGRHRIIRLIILSLLLQNFPTKFTLVMGQVNLIVLLLLVLSFIKDQENKQTQSGIFWGLASMIKLIPLPLALYFLIKKRFKTLFVGLSLSIVSNLSLILLFPKMSSYFLTTLPGLGSPLGKGVSLYDQSLRAFFMRLALPQSYELSIFTGILLLFFAVKKYLNYRQDLTFFSLILATTTITNSFAWQHHFVFLFPTFIVLVKHLSSKRALYGILLFISFILLSSHFPDPLNPPTNNPLLLSHTLIGSLIVIILLLVVKVKKYQRSIFRYGYKFWGK